jgi:hypothetical protein
LIDGGVLFSQKIEPKNSQQSNHEHKHDFESICLIEVDRECAQFEALADRTLVMHFSPVMYHKLLAFNKTYSNNMV